MNCSGATALLRSIAARSPRRSKLVACGRTRHTTRAFQTTCRWDPQISCEFALKMQIVGFILLPQKAPSPKGNQQVYFGHREPERNTQTCVQPTEPGWHPYVAGLNGMQRLECTKEHQLDWTLKPPPTRGFTCRVCRSQLPKNAFRLDRT